MRRLPRLPRKPRLRLRLRLRLLFRRRHQQRASARSPSPSRLPSPSRPASSRASASRCDACSTTGARGSSIDRWSLRIDTGSRLELALLIEVAFIDGTNETTASHTTKHARSTNRNGMPRLEDATYSHHFSPIKIITLVQHHIGIRTVHGTILAVVPDFPIDLAEPKIIQSLLPFELLLKPIDGSVVIAQNISLLLVLVWFGFYGDLISKRRRRSVSSGLSRLFGDPSVIVFCLSLGSPLVSQRSRASVSGGGGGGASSSASSSASASSTGAAAAANPPPEGRRRKKPSVPTGNQVLPSYTEFY